MNKIFLSICATLLAGPLTGQELGPELTPLATRHEAGIKAIDAERTVALDRVRQHYLDELATAEKTSSNAGRLSEVAAILKEREAMQVGALEITLPADLPKALERRRNEYVTATNAIDRDFAPKYQRVNAEYLRSLASVESRATGNPELQKQIAAEKAHLVNNAPSAGVRQLSDRILAGSEWEWLGKEKGPGKAIWQFLATGRIDTGGEHYWNWKIVGPDRFAIVDGAKVLWEAKVNFQKMEAEVTSPNNPKEHKRMKYKGAISK